MGGGHPWSLVTADLDTLLTALYVLIDDHVIPSGQRRPGRPKKLSDAELVCLAVAQVLLGARSEHHWLRMCYARLGHLFPYLGYERLADCWARRGRVSADTAQLVSGRSEGRVSADTAQLVSGRSDLARMCPPGAGRAATRPDRVAAAGASTPRIRTCSRCCGGWADFVILSSR